MIEDVFNAKLLDKLALKKRIPPSVKDSIFYESKSQKKTVSSILISRSLVSEQELISFLCEELGYTPIPLESIIISDEVLKLVPFAFANKYMVIPTSKHENILTIAMENPGNLSLIDDLKALTNLRIKPVLAPFATLQKTIQKFYQNPSNPELTLPKSEETVEDLIRIVQDAKAGEDGDEIGNLMRQAQETPVIKVANLLLVDGIKRKASDIFIEPWEDSIRVRYRVDGLLEEGKSPSKNMGLALVSRFKVMSQLNIAERRIPQDGRFRIKVQDREVDIRVSLVPSSFGEKICLRILDKKTQAQSIERLGFTANEIEELKGLSTKPHGMILVTGPTGSGKTTTLYSILKHLDSPEKNITTVEDPVEYQVEGINQVNVKEKVGLTFPIALRSILRQDPNVILIGEIRDNETMDIAIKAALTGHLVLSSLHTNDTSGAVVRMINMGIEPYLISSSVLVITAQRLIRRLCPDCKIVYKPDAAVCKQLRLPPQKAHTFYKAAGCQRCRDTGYSGRTVITEILGMTPAIKELIMKKATGEEVKQKARASGMTTLRESAVRKVVEGETSVDEMFRITTGDQEIESDLVKP